MSAARSTSDLPCSAVVRAARTFALAASRVSLRACVRTRRPVNFDGVVAVVERVERRAAGLRLRAAGFLLAAGFFAVAAGLLAAVVVVVVVSLSAMWDFPLP